ncbi:unnamed protein product [Periconia digitata]|uniref:Amidase domain-containing protein n=1 Tax=Periconia digitata TaxID=1303443 RepID=A0A9W4U4I2_9PLEO|nr:unnamed protein product [Periconia digitata]
MTSSLAVAKGRAQLTGWIPTLPKDTAPLFDSLTSSAGALQFRLHSGELTSVQILREYYRQILSFNGYLRAIHQLAPGAMARAEHLDQLRREGFVLGPLHGIPVLLKDNIGTDGSFEMDTTAGSPALVASIPRRNSPIVDQLVDAGAIILGKATLSELNWFKGHKVSSGWSSLCGQGQNPYVMGGYDRSDGISGHSGPGGSSSGSCIAVAAGLAPISIGTDTEGSINCPATRNSLYSIKPSRGSVSNELIVPISSYLDVAGPIGTTTEDIANLLTVLVGSNRPDVPSGGYLTAMRGADGWEELSVGVLDPEKWRYDGSIQTENPSAIQDIKRITLEAYDRIRCLAKSYHFDVSLRHDRDFNYEGGNGIVEIMIADFERDFDRYLEDTINTKVQSVKELLQWNYANEHIALPAENPGQESLEEALSFPRSTDRREKLLKHIKEVGQSFPDTLEKYSIDVIIGPGDSWFTKYSAATGFPNCSLPIGYIDFRGRPVGLTAIARSEVTLIKLMSAHEASFPARKPPSAFLEHKDL